MAYRFSVLCCILACVPGTSLSENEDTMPTDHCDGAEASEASVSLLQSSMVLQSRGELDHLQPAVGSLAFEAFAKTEKDARAKLVKGSLPGAHPPGQTIDGAPVFSSVVLSLPLSPPIVNREQVLVGSEDVLEDKNIITYGVRPPCLVYGLGVATAATGQGPDLENQMAKAGCEVHAFDCSLEESDPNVKNAKFKFHKWCIGKQSQDESLKDSIYVKEGRKEGANAQLDFKSLKASMKELGHSHVDLLKFDIEGSEWGLFENELLTMDKTQLPRQLSFELHTEGADPRFVPAETTKGKTFTEVNKLFLKLHDMGYRVISKTINMSDKKCAEFVLVLNTPGSAKKPDQKQG